VQSQTQTSFPVDRLLNPCQCKSIWECQCKQPPDSSDQTRLETLVQVANSVSSNPIPPAPVVQRSCCKRKTPPLGDTGHVRGPDLPPLLLDPDRTVPPLHDAPRFTTPTSIPSIKSVVLLAGTGCSCGFECTCPGCIEHRVPPSSTQTQGVSNLKDCSQGCLHCVDRLGGVALPEPDSASHQSPFGSIIDTFLSRATRLPPPPKNRPGDIDPTNITVFPPSLFSADFARTTDGNGGQQGKARLAWGLVDVPKLECCGGACGCPDGRCICGNSCAGCCVEGDASPDIPGSGTLAEPMRLY